MYVYVESKSKANDSVLYTVGFYAPDAKWHADTDHLNRKEAADRVHYLNGGNGAHR